VSTLREVLQTLNPTRETAFTEWSEPSYTDCVACHQLYLRCILSNRIPYLQDHFRKVVKPSYTNVVPDRGGAMGVVEFETPEDLERAIRKLDDTEFRNPFDRGYIRIIEDDGGRGGGGGRSSRRSRSRSRSR